MTLEIDLSGRHALVTGAGQGVGRAIALTLAAAGAAVTVNDLMLERAESVCDEIAVGGGQASPLVLDVTDWGSVSEAFGGLGVVDILVNNAGNAGVVTGGFETLVPLVETLPAQWEPFLRVNLYGVMYCTRAALEGMIPNGWGRIVTVISDSARTGQATMAAYAAAKAGAAGFCRSVAQEVGRFGITANCVALGSMRTPSSGGDGDDADNEVVQRLLKRYVIRRRGEPEDVAGLVALLASPLASWITGQTYPINGGFSVAL